MKRGSDSLWSGCIIHRFRVEHARICQRTRRGPVFHRRRNIARRKGNPRECIVDFVRGAEGANCPLYDHLAIHDKGGERFQRLASNWHLRVRHRLARARVGPSAAASLRMRTTRRCQLALLLSLACAARTHSASQRITAYQICITFHLSFHHPQSQIDSG
jgi:hypothetical protein